MLFVFIVGAVVLEWKAERERERERENLMDVRIRESGGK